jgi:hypothetical protein
VLGRELLTRIAVIEFIRFLQWGWFVFLYVASLLGLATIGCFLELQETRLDLKKMQEP